LSIEIVESRNLQIIADVQNRIAHVRDNIGKRIDKLTILSQQFQLLQQISEHRIPSDRDRQEKDKILLDIEM
jgi:hypothetical protein